MTADEWDAHVTVHYKSESALGRLRKKYPDLGELFDDYEVTLEKLKETQQELTCLSNRLKDLEDE